MIALHDALTEYLATRRALGTQLKWPESSLRRFVDYVESQGAKFLTIELALRWAVQPVGVQRATHAGRLRIVRGFAAWLQALDPRTQVPPLRLLPAAYRRPPPHIYSDGELADLMAAAGQLPSASGLRGATYKTLLGLLAATGLRPGEARALDVGDVDLVDGVLTIRSSKFGKSRIVPLDVSAHAALVAYAKFRDRARPRRETPAFLVTAQGLRLSGSAIRWTFARLCEIVGLRPCQHPRRSGRGPRLHDIRHTFATRRLIEWYRAGLHVDHLVLHLSTYLGHSSPAETYWYIQSVPDLLNLATERLESAPQSSRRGVR